MNKQQSNIVAVNRKWIRVDYSYQLPIDMQLVKSLVELKNFPVFFLFHFLTLSLEFFAKCQYFSDVVVTFFDFDSSGSERVRNMVTM